MHMSDKERDRQKTKKVRISLMAFLTHVFLECAGTVVSGTSFQSFMVAGSKDDCLNI